MADAAAASPPTSEGRLGPLVHRAVHHAAALWLIASVQFVLAMAIVQLAWKGPPAYSLAHNYISDLGNTHLSPWHDVFNASIIVLGLLVIGGSILVRTAFPPRRTSQIGLLMIAIGGIGSIGVGLFPENVDLKVHSISALIAFLVGNLSLVVLALAMFRDTRWDGLRAYTLFSGLVGLAATFLFVGKVYAGLGPGGMERLIVAPLLLWLAVVSVRLLRIRQYAPHALPTPSSH